MLQGWPMRMASGYTVPPYTAVQRRSLTLGSRVALLLVEWQSDLAHVLHPRVEAFLFQLSISYVFRNKMMKVDESDIRRHINVREWFTTWQTAYLLAIYLSDYPVILLKP